jgi:hypothetical protein
VSRYIPQDDVEMAVLYRLFEFAQSASERLAPDKVAALFGTELSVKRIEMALGALERRKFVYTAYPTVQSPESDITEAGYRAVERGLADPDSFYSKYHKLGDSWLTRNDDDLFGAPSADGFVRFDHNSAAFNEISEQFDVIKEAVRTTNDLDEAERSRVLAGLTAAETLWHSAQLKLIQVKVGVLMAAEDAASLLASTSKAVAAALFVDAIKALVKAQIGIDLDSL